MLKKFLFLFLIIHPNFLHSSENVDFSIWLEKFKNFALKEGVSAKTINGSLKNVKYLDQVIKYDRKQPEFFEDTSTYIKKRATRSRVNKAKKLRINNISVSIIVN